MKTLRGEAGFRAHYGALFEARWPELESALSEPVQQVVRINPFAAWPAALDALPDLPGCIDPAQAPDPPYYAMDGASVFAARALPLPERGGAVLDLCAAPGGKALILAERLGPETTLCANERSAARRARLRQVLESRLPAERQARVRVTGHDATRWSQHERDAYDAILLDAPCSSERHLLHKPAELRRWSGARSRNLAQRQYAMLASALDVVRVGGHILYATCALDPRENEGVVERLDKKRKGRARVVPLRLPLGEAHGPGWRFLPDGAGGYGPLFVSLLERVA